MHFNCMQFIFILYSANFLLSIPFPDYFILKEAAAMRQASGFPAFEAGIMLY